MTLNICEFVLFVFFVTIGTRFVYFAWAYYYVFVVLVFTFGCADNSQVIVKCVKDNLGCLYP